MISSTSFCLAVVRLNLESCAQVWAPQFIKPMELLETVLKKATVMMEGWEHLTSQERLKELGRYYYLMVDWRLWSHSLLSRAQSQDKTEWTQIETQAFLSEHKERGFCMTEHCHRFVWSDCCFLKGIQKLSGHSPRQLSPADTAWTWYWTRQWVSHPKLKYSVILWLTWVLRGTAVQITYWSTKLWSSKYDTECIFNSLSIMNSLIYPCC